MVAAPVILDTLNFQDGLKDIKWIQLDADVMDQLKELSPFLKTNHQMYAKQLMGWKFHISDNISLGIDNNLIKNFKAYRILAKAEGKPTGFGVSSVYIPADHLLGWFGVDVCCAAM